MINRWGWEGVWSTDGGGKGYDQQIGVWKGVWSADRCGKGVINRWGWEGVSSADRSAKGYGQQMGVGRVWSAVHSKNLGFRSMGLVE